jgi:hypothetical protein
MRLGGPIQIFGSSKGALSPQDWLAENETHLAVSEIATTNQCIGRLADERPRSRTKLLAPMVNIAASAI